MFDGVPAFEPAKMVHPHDNGIDEVCRARRAGIFERLRAKTVSAAIIDEVVSRRYNEPNN